VTWRLDRQAVEIAGWTVIDLLDPDEVAAATACIASMRLPEDHGFFASPAQAWGPVARSVDRQLKALVGPRLARALPDHRPFLAGITSKGRRSDQPIPFHQDWTYTDERRHRPVFFWCSLVDTDLSNGGLSVVPGSHRWSTGIRPSREHEASEGLQSELAARAQPVALRAGQAVVFDPAMFHGSGANHTDAPRPAFTVAVVPNEAELLHFHETSDGSLLGFRVDEDFFTMNAYRTCPSGYPSIEPFERAITRTDLVDALNRDAVG
jgi:hypothetical protein